MTRLINEPVKVHMKSALSAFIWRKRIYRVDEILSQWREPSQWWNYENLRTFVRVSANHGSVKGIYELYNLGPDWFVHKVID